MVTTSTSTVPVRKLTKALALDIAKQLFSGVPLDEACGEFSPSEVFDKLDGMSAQLAKLSGAEKKPTKAQKENAELSAEVLVWMQSSKELMTATDILRACPVLDGLAIQKVTPILNGLVKAGSLEKVMDKRKTLFKAV